MKIRIATREDVPYMVAMLADDKLGILREDYQIPLPKKYFDAFQKINQDPNQFLIVGVIEGEIVGTAQLSLIPYLTYQGGIRAQIEAVRVKSTYRGSGLGENLIQWMIQKARESGAHLIQLTTDKKRPEALKFYEKLGFNATHEGMKMHF
ncbi:transcriptional regulator [Ekhidna lutea]|uniref:Transcriptional regulator n=1 Tax=Ekhidna lutea TaxID=447679 RepID=A0A239K5Q3_EKHLU|nr:GNAT family N-acetyltransferase [Ekhidna lutea]SNT13290.1 transcriptional regulator [Ekhidna lutea]